MGNCCPSTGNNVSKKSDRNRLLGTVHRGGGGSGSGSAGFEENELHRIQDRKFLNSSTEVACLFTQQGMKGTNQDSMLLWENFSSKKDTIFCGVFDGHGPYGHMVSKRVRDSLPLKLCSQWEVNSPTDQNDSEETASINIDDEWCHSNFDDNEKLPEMYLPLKQSLLKAFKLMDKDLKQHPTPDCFCSGTTAVTLVKRGRHLVIGNVGDSRAVLGMRDEDNSLSAVQLTVDLKPNLPKEAARIQQCNGRVFALQDEPDVARVWLPNHDSPGLAMARAFGDFCLKDFGLISVPDVSYRYLTEKDEFIVLATDGVWDVLSNKEVVDIVASAPSYTMAARAVVECAVRAWRLKFPTSKIDDCAAVCLFLNRVILSNQVEERPEETDPTISAAEFNETKNLSTPSSNSDDGRVHDPVLEHLNTLRNIDEIVPVSELKENLRVRSQSTRSLSECISTAEDEEWSALEGVTRVNSLLTIPRFLASENKVTHRKKWF